MKKVTRTLMTDKAYNTAAIYISLKRLWGHINFRRRRQFILLLIFMIFTSIVEVISIGSVIPFLGALASPEKIFSSSLITPFIYFFSIKTPNQIIIPLAMFFCLCAFFSGITRLILLKLTIRFSFAIGADLGVDIYTKTLYQPYKAHIARNSSEIINAVSINANALPANIIFPVLTLITSGIIFLAVLFVIFLSDPIASSISSVFFGLIYFYIAKKTTNKKIENSTLITQYSIQIIKSLQEGIGAIRDVLIDGSQKIHCDIYAVADRSLRQAQASNQFYNQGPRLIMESLGIVLVASFTLYLFSKFNGISEAIPTIGVLALGAQKLLPVLQQIYQAWSTIQGNYSSLQSTLTFLDQKMPRDYSNLNSLELKFHKNIQLSGVQFRYTSQNHDVIKNLNLTIKKGDRIGIIGVTGSGKSTLIDILMGLLEPTNGSLKIDGKKITALNVRAWQKHIAHVPQFIFLSDTTIAENIAFSVDKKAINYELVHDAANKAKLHKVINQLPNKYNTKIGERGIKLSGGQRQRIGIARALYKNADVFIFDEATSSLDNQTEDLVMNSLDDLGSEITIIMIAHRLTTLKKCNKIIEIADGKIVNVGSYRDIIKSSH